MTRRCPLGAPLLALALLALASAAAARGADTPVAAPDIEVFTREGCPFCAAARVFLDDLRRERPGLSIVYSDLEDDPAALARLRALGARLGVERLGVPAFYARGQLIVGFLSADTTGARLRALLDAPGPTAAVPPADREVVEAPLFGRLSARALGLPLFTVALGLLDGFNPCAMWVLLFVLSLLVNLKDRVKMALIAGTFVFVSGLAYFLFMAAWLNVFLLVGVSRPLQVALGLAAGAVGAINVKVSRPVGEGGIYFRRREDGGNIGIIGRCGSTSPRGEGACRRPAGVPAR
ncbi:MAG: glutaredoxin, partial [Candidatus Rokubacteria bacterium]|nr:glutaredoxin [Candidatus Rokubacteria bacterium]